MSQSISDQHPAVVLRSHYNHMRALLAAVTVALVVLAITVAILAVDSNGAGSSTAGAQQVNTPAPSASDASHPDEGTRGPFAAPRSDTGR
jgi:predicted metal-binding membrane protein